MSNNEVLHNKIIEIDINLHEQKMSISSLENTLERIISVLEKLTRIEQENAVIKSELNSQDKRINSLEDRNKWIYRTIVGVLVVTLGQFFYDSYKDLNKDKKIKNNIVVSKRTTINDK